MAETTHITFGFVLEDFSDIALELEILFGITWELHDSFYRGEYNIYPPWEAQQKGHQGEKFALLHNFVESMEDWTIEEHKNCAILFHITNSNRQDSIKKTLSVRFGEKVMLLEDDYSYIDPS